MLDAVLSALHRLRSNRGGNDLIAYGPDSEKGAKAAAGGPMRQRNAQSTTGALQTAIQRGKLSASAAMGCASSSIADVRLRASAERFVSFRTKLRTLDAALRRHHDDARRAERSRSDLVGALAEASRGSVAYELVGRIADPADEAAAAAAASARDGEAGGTPSYAEVHADIGHARTPHLDRLREETLAYASEWERTVSTRIATELRHVRRLHSAWLKQHRKVEGLRAKANKRKDGPSESDLERIERNESKLRTARKDYRRNLVAVTLLVEEVTDRGWKDLIPLVLQLIEFDVETASRTAELAARLTDVREETKALARRYEMDYAGMTAGRLRVLLEEDATEFVDPVDMQDIESIQPSVGTSSVGTPTTFGNPGVVRGRPEAPPRPPAIEENPDEEGAGSPRSAADDHAYADPAGRTPPCSEGDDSLSLERPERDGRGGAPPQRSGSDPSAPPLDLMSAAISRGEDAAKNGGREVQPRDRLGGAPPPRGAKGGGNGGEGGGGGGANLDDEQSKINFPTSIYFAEECYKDDVTALTPYPDLVSI